MEKKVMARLGKGLVHSKSLKERLERLWELSIVLWKQVRRNCVCVSEKW